MAWFGLVKSIYDINLLENKPSKTPTLIDLKTQNIFLCSCLSAEFLAQPEHKMTSKCWRKPMNNLMAEN